MKIIRNLIIVLFTLCPLIIRSEELSPQAKSFRSNIQSFLREEGFVPTIDSDGDLCFKIEGISYWIKIIGDKPFYVAMYREPLGCEGANAMNILRAINEVNNSYRAVKCCYFDNYISFGIETYCYVAEDFKYAFFTYINILNASDEALIKEYSKYDTSFDNVASRISGNRIIIDSPVLETDYHKWWITSLELNSRNTVVHKVVTPKCANTYICSTKDEYIEDCDTGKKYYILSSSIGISPQRTILQSKDPKAFTDTYPPLPPSVKRINIWSGDDYYVRGLQIR